MNWCSHRIQSEVHHVNCCFSELALKNLTIKRVGLVQSGPHHHLIKTSVAYGTAQVAFAEVVLPEVT
jgi:hypothetical protein